jgi:hypothetical protein
MTAIVLLMNNSKSWVRQLGHETLKTGGCRNHDTIP